MLVGPHDVGDLHGGVIDDAGEIVERRPVRPDDDEIADFIGGELDVALDQVVEDERPSGGTSKRRANGRPSASSWAASTATVLAAESVGPLVTLGRGIVGRALAIGAIVAIDVAGGEQLVGGPWIAFGALRLV